MRAASVAWKWKWSDPGLGKHGAPASGSVMREALAASRGLDPCPDQLREVPVGVQVQVERGEREEGGMEVGVTARGSVHVRQAYYM